MTSTAEQMRSYSGPALFSFGFRPFFLFGAVWAAIAVALWLPLLTGHLSLPTAFNPIAWHVHELLFGYVPAAIAGFLLTAVPNWTGRLPVVGGRLAALFGLWVLGRIAVLTSALIGPAVAAVIDVGFLVALGVVIAREILAAGNTRNLKVLVVVGLLAIANAVFHYEAMDGGAAAMSSRLGVGAVVLLIMLIGGRITPSFTRNWLVRQPPGRLPAAMDRFDIGVMLASAIALASWVVAPETLLTGGLCVAAAVLNLVRVGRWAGWRTTGEPLLLVLHVGFLFVPVGFVLAALAALAPAAITTTGALHAWTAGAIGVMTLAVMTRASLGHTGQELTATAPITFIYVAAFIAACCRVLAAFGIASDLMLHVSAAAWVVAFGMFAAVFAPLLLRPRR